jgi:Tripartite tricarboxylate transporter TctB family
MASDQEPREPEAAGGQLVIPIAALLFTLYYFSTIIHSPFEAQVAAFFVGTILLILIALFLMKTALRLHRGEVDLRLGELFRPKAILPKRAGLLALTVGYLLVIPYLGFTITTFLYLAGSMLLLGARQRPLVTVGLAAAIALAGYLLFILAFDTRFPRGPFEELMRALL